MPTRKRRIKQADITFISLCPKGKNRLPVLFKDDGAFELDTLVKDDRLEEEGVITAVVWAPEVVDTEGDFASSQAIKEMAYSFARNGHALDIRHNLKPVAKEDAFVAESFIIKKNDPDFANQKDRDGKPVDVTGGWAVVIKLDKEELKADYRAGKWNGVSMYGNAQVELVNKGEPNVDSILDALAERLTGQTQTTDMELKDIQAAITAGNEALSKSLVEALTPLLKKSDDKKSDDKKSDDDEPKFTGDPLKKEDVAAHLKVVKAWRLAKSVDFTDPKALENYLATFGKSDDDKKEDDKEESEEVKSLRKQLEKAIKASTQGTGDDDDDKKKKNVKKSDEQVGNVTGISKEDFTRAQRMAAYINGTDPTKKS